MSSSLNALVYDTSYKLPLDVDDAIREPEDIQKFVAMYQALVKHIPVQAGSHGPEFATVFQPSGIDENGTKHYIHIGPLEVVITVPTSLLDEAKIEAYIDPPLFRPIFVTAAKGALLQGSKMDLLGYPDIVSGDLTAKVSTQDPAIILDYDFMSGKKVHKGKVIVPL